jgi:AraC-like DNA-binding protein
MRPLTSHLPNYSIILMRELLAEFRLDTHRALEQSGCDPAQLEDPAAAVTRAQELAFQRAFYEQTADHPDLWVELGKRLEVLHMHHSLGLALVTAPTFHEIFTIGFEFAGLSYTTTRLVGLERGDRWMSFCYDTQAEVTEGFRQFTLIRDFASQRPMFRKLWGNEFPFQHIETQIAGGYRAYLRGLTDTDTPIIFDAPLTRWSWATEFGERELPQSNPLLHRRFRQECQLISEGVVDERDPVQRLRRLLDATPTQPSIDAAANQLGVSPRTLQRRLSQRGISFRELTGVARFKHACHLLAQGNAAIADIAEQLGYGSVGYFIDVFKRRAGVTPGAYRRRTTRPAVAGARSAGPIDTPV